MVRSEHRISFPAVSLFLILLSLTPLPLFAQDSPDESPAKTPAQPVSIAPEPAAKPGPDPSAKAESCSVGGIVVSAASSDPLRGARVTLSASDAERRSTRNYTASTDGNGHFFIGNIAPG